MRSGSIVGRLAFAAAMVVSLAAGAQSAFARPAPVEERGAACYSGYCHRECREYGWSTGHCLDGYCECRNV
ncbi:MAG TPA: hypothetical protein VGC13_00720 [Longimicrobium sp.]|jgi:hypothetical protein|uniref:hypothetical protein n=1 Tax=Longimicrobium sp. TaxID=2029185 RepID=UPI002ED901D4